MYGRYSLQGYKHVMSKIRHHALSAYATARHFGTSLDRAVQLGTKMYSVAAPVLRDIAPEAEKAISRGVAQTKGSYEQLREGIVAVDYRAQGHVERINSAAAVLGLQ